MWTVHNLTANDQTYVRLERIHLRLLLKITDGLCFLNNASRDDFLAVNPSASALPYAVVPIGPYPPLHERIRQPASKGTPRLLFFGRIRPYKGLEELARAATACNVSLRVVGSGADPSIDLNFERLHEESLFDGYQEEDLEVAASQSDLAVFPFRSVTNSSSVVHALSLGLPVVGPNVAALRELREFVGGDWMHLYSDDTFSVATLQRVLKWFQERTASTPPDLEPLSWEYAARETLTLYGRVTGSDQHQA